MSKRISKIISWIIILSTVVFISSIIISPRINSFTFVQVNVPIIAIISAEDVNDDQANESIISEFGFPCILYLDLINEPDIKISPFCNNLTSNRIQALKSQMYQSLLCIYIC